MPPRGVYLIAFVTRLRKSWRSRVAIAEDRDRSRPPASTREPGVLAEDHRGLDDLVHERLELDRLAMQIEAPLVGARERQQDFDEIRHARRLLQRLLERDELLGAVGDVCHRALDVGAQHRQRRLELVARVGGEAAQRGERCLEARDHRVQRRCRARRSRHRVVSTEVAGADCDRRVIASTSLTICSIGRNARPAISVTRRRPMTAMTSGAMTSDRRQRARDRRSGGADSPRLRRRRDRRASSSRSPDSATSRTLLFRRHGSRACTSESTACCMQADRSRR